MEDSDFSKLYSEYYDAVFRYAFSLCGNETIAEELTQESFFKALKSISKFRGECKLNVWLCQIAKNTFLTMKKRKMPEADYPLELIPDDISLEQQLIDRDDAVSIIKLIDALEMPYRDVFRMRVLGEMPYSEIASMFGKTESWARVTYHRAKMKIREDLK